MQQACFADARFASDEGDAEATGGGLFKLVPERDEFLLPSRKAQRLGTYSISHCLFLCLFSLSLFCCRVSLFI
jgi:hypothetical protein